MKELDYGFYSSVFHGTLDEDGFASALIPAKAELLALTGTDIPSVHEQNWLYALCALIDFKADSRNGVKSERVGGTAYTYSDQSADMGACDVVAPYLSGTGLLWQGV